MAEEPHGVIIVGTVPVTFRPRYITSNLAKTQPFPGLGCTTAYFPSKKTGQPLRDKRLTQ